LRLDDVGRERVALSRGGHSGPLDADIGTQCWEGPARHPARSALQLPTSVNLSREVGRCNTQMRWLGPTLGRPLAARGGPLPGCGLVLGRGAGGHPLLELLERLRPVRLEELREGAVREELALGLALRAVVRLVVAADDSLHGRAAVGAGLA